MYIRLSLLGKEIAMNKIKLLLLSIPAILLTLGCQKQDDLDRLGDLDISKPAVIGGSLLSGYQDGALYTKGQENSIPALLFEQMALYADLSFDIPLIEQEQQDGIGLNLYQDQSTFRKRSRLALTIGTDGEPSLGPVFEIYNTDDLADLNNSYSNLGGQYQCIPFAKTSDLLDANLGVSLADGGYNPFYHRFAANPGVSTPTEELTNYAPSFLLASLGLEDIFNYAMFGADNQPLTSVGDFEAAVDEILGNIISNGTKGVLINIPEIEDLPFFNLIPYNAAPLDEATAAQLTQLNELSGFSHISFEEGDNPFVIFDDEQPSGRRQLMLGERVLFSLPLNLVSENLVGIQNPMPQNFVLTLQQLSTIRSATQQYNQVIEKMAVKYDLALFDLQSFMKEMNMGVKWNAIDYSLEFVSGGFMSLDGLFPTQKGGSLITNGIIEEINNKYGANIPSVNCLDCDAVLFPN